MNSAEMSELEKIDLIRARTNLSYTEARNVLEEAQGDVVQALILLEQRGTSRVEWIQAKGSEVLDKVKDLVKEGNVRRIRVRTGEDVMLDVPVTAGVVGAVLAPSLAVVGAIAALATNCTIEIERKPEPVVSVTTSPND